MRRFLPTLSARWWLSPYLPGQILLTSACFYGRHTGDLLLFDAGHDRLALHVYNALRAGGYMVPMEGLDRALDFVAKCKCLWPTGIPTAAHGSFVTSYDLSCGSAIRDVATAAMKTLPDHVSEAVAAFHAHHEKRDRRSNLQKAQGKPTTSTRKRTAMALTELSCAWQYMIGAEPLPWRKGSSLPDMVTLRRVVDDEWHRFLHLDLIAVDRILIDATDPLEVYQQGARLLLGWSDFRVENAVLDAVVKVLVAAETKGRDAVLMPKAP
ncbi:hypothetical protein SDRG_02529 [Saprolegnia diclina VS20]|uniref:Uncharacterized protein n=1 Tax=Saprolegnia diclina (strain VS20) TaxID=1156394 RepID=T0SAM2_SAPDV|nr:hypothetical protein SDRG_02529 [Saprolegnia diclina VS20]EQC39872.1 hypothetical protein SDRG_02529 [Saprolegnia diclina VS20]|eukprot:XP_008606346.1 hypothetical protein SDRG_02529 [Saprolegnia diclina VS20]